LYYLLFIDYGEPKCYEEAMQGDTKNKWEQGMKEEMDSLVNIKNWDLVHFLAGKRFVGTGADPGFNAQQCTNKTLTTIPFGNTCGAGEVSPEVEAGGVT
jgi:hypothetical protein